LVLTFRMAYAVHDWYASTFLLNLAVAPFSRVGPKPQAVEVFAAWVHALSVTAPRWLNVIWLRKKQRTQPWQRRTENSSSNGASWPNTLRLSILSDARLRPRRSCAAWARRGRGCVLQFRFDHRRRRYIEPRRYSTSDLNSFGARPNTGKRSRRPPNDQRRCNRFVQPRDGWHEDHRAC
jgi:hypothetical protein